MHPCNGIESIAADLFSFLAGRFPVCCRSDEFVFFPQALPPDPDWSVWDDFSPESVQETILTLGFLKARVGKIVSDSEELERGDRETALLLAWVMDVLQEQLEDVRIHCSQPTFYLTQASVGLVQAIETGNPAFFSDRIRGLPEFLERSFSFLEGMPDVFLRRGVEMAEGLLKWISSFAPYGISQDVLASLDFCRKKLLMTSPTGDFRLKEDLLERIVHHHTGSRLTISECLRELEEEIECALAILREESRNSGLGEDWSTAWSRIPEDPVPGKDKRGLLAEEIARQRDHCRRIGILDPEQDGKATLSIEPLPPSLRAIRTSDSYCAHPGSPFPGGVFYIFEEGGIGRAGSFIRQDYRVTSAHEVYPGHHLLDLCRWNGIRPARRPVEYPLFYEGWACFGEGMMLETGAFDRPWDRLIVARRRYVHAVRGQVDLLLHMGSLDFAGAARRFCELGFSPERAGDTAGKYALRPGYQLCYTIGRRRFQSFFDSRRGMGTGFFARAVLEEGEILFGGLERILESKKDEG